MSNANLVPYPRFKGFTRTGGPLANGKVYTYVAGSSTPLATYTNALGAIANANPVILDANGEADIWYTPGNSYKIILTDSAGVTQWSVDSIYAGDISNITQLASLVGVGTAISAWQSGTYGIDIGTLGAIEQLASGAFAIMYNAYRDTSGNDIYKANGYAAYISFDTAGTITINYAASGTAGGAITWSTASLLGPAPATNYKRLPNYYINSASNSYTNISTATTTTIPAPNASAIAVKILLTAIVYGKSSGSTTYRTAIINACQDSGATILYGTAEVAAWDQVLGTQALAQDSSVADIYLSAKGANSYLQTLFTGSSTQGLFTYSILGYYV